MKLPIMMLFDIYGFYYAYDSITNNYVKISKEAYDFFKEAKLHTKIGEEISNEIINKYEEGYNLVKMLIEKNNILNGFDFGQPKYWYNKENIKDLLENKSKVLVLEVTKKCNFRCKYCCWSDTYYEKDCYANKDMSIDIIKKSLDNFLNYSKDSENIAISFYGGEPLIAFNNIKFVVDYINKNVKTKKHHYNFTTNLYLLDETILDFLYNNNFHLLVSLDGPQWIHDAGRITINNSGTYEKIFNNLMMIKNKYPVYFKNNISFNAVIPQLKYKDYVINFFVEKFPENRFMFSDLSPGYNIEKINEYFQILNKNKLFYKIKDLKKEEKISERYYLGLVDSTKERIKLSVYDDALAPYFKNIDIKLKNNGYFWNNGCCILGQRKMFVDVNGNIFPCEKVDINNEKYLIGNVSDGYNYKKIDKIINDFSSLIQKCNKCWAIVHCHMCWKFLYSNIDKCKTYRSEVYFRIKKAITILEFNPKLVKEFDKIKIK
ncbi:MAG: radical SAM protein [Bacilli bacterium]|nr:radical SAM protein [Bacilli bacterium]